VGSTGDADSARVAGGDEFIANLWQVHQRVKGEGYVQPLTLGLFRSDYMVHKDGDNLQIKQVEFNTIASSFGGLSSKTSLLHKYSLFPSLVSTQWLTDSETPRRDRIPPSQHPHSQLIPQPPLQRQRQRPRGRHSSRLPRLRPLLTGPSSLRPLPRSRR